MKRTGIVSWILPFLAVSSAKAFNWSQVSTACIWHYPLTEQVAPSTELRYHQCFDDFDCARLRVPLDWQAPDNRTVDIAVIKLNATVAVTNATYGGAVVLNPGKPNLTWRRKCLEPNTNTRGSGRLRREPGASHRQSLAHNCLRRTRQPRRKGMSLRFT